jgi:oxaloacetate decarboxylase (Na+ extruding) subunit alpha
MMVTNAGSSALAEIVTPSAPLESQARDQQDADIAERVLARQRTDALRVLEPVGLDGARSRFGRTISDEELLLRLTMPAEQVDSIGASEPARAASRRVSASEHPEHHPVVTLLDEVARRAAITHLRVETGDELVEWRRPS